MENEIVSKEDISRILRSSKPRLEYEIEKLLLFTKDIQFFKKINAEYGSNEIHKECCNAMTLEEYEPNDIIINFGEIGEKFYVILKGSVSVTRPIKKRVKLDSRQTRYNEIKQADSFSQSSSDEDINELKEGDFFGETALMSDRPRNATIIATDKTSLLVLKKHQFKAILGSLAEKRINHKIKFLQSLPYFLSWSKSSLLKLAFYFQINHLRHKQNLFAEGEKTSGIYFIREGEFMLTKKIELPKHSRTRLYTFSTENDAYSQKKIKLPRVITSMKIIIKGKNESIGGYEVLNNLPNRCYTCVCNSTKAEVFFVEKEVFLTRIPNIEVIKEILEEENKRLIQRENYTYKVEESKNTMELPNNLSPTHKNSKNNHSINSIVHKSSPGLKIFNKSSFTPPPARNPAFSKPALSTHKPKLSFRKLTQNEINQAINGRSPRFIPKPNRIIKPPKKKFPPVSFMQKLRETINNN
jgi:CRP-like cAMP-binding protein